MVLFDKLLIAGSIIALLINNSGLTQATAAPPTIVLEPISVNIDLTQTATFTCSATGYNVNYKWAIRSGSFPSKVTGINTNTLVIPNVRSSDDNTYTCVASNEGGSVSSNGAKLTVTGLPEVTVTPSSQSVEVTDTATFYAVVRGVGSDKFTYQWRKGQNNIRNANGPSLMITNIKKKNAGLYRCVVENKNGDTVVSKAVRLSVARVVCPALRNPRNGMVNVVGTSAVYTCNPGYILLGGASVQCISGQWSSRPPTCVIFTVP